MSELMTAVVFDRYGSADVLELRSRPRPVVAEHDVLVAVSAVGVNPADWQLRNGRFRRFLRLSLPFVPGSDLAGHVAAVGRSVTRYAVGDAVYAMSALSSGGGYADYAAVAEEWVAAAPTSVSLEQAAAVPRAGLTALQALRDKAGLHRGQRVLINGASGGVGTLAVQIAKILGADVTGVCGAANGELVRGLGADATIDYRRQDVTAGERRYDVIFDARASVPFRRWLRILSPGGVLVSVNPVLRNPATRLVFALTRRRIQSLLVKPSADDLSQLTSWIDSGRLRPVIDRVYPLSAAADAHRYSETLHAAGKIVLVPGKDRTTDV